MASQPAPRAGKQDKKVIAKLRKDIEDKFDKVSTRYDWKKGDSEAEALLIQLYGGPCGIMSCCTPRPGKRASDCTVTLLSTAALLTWACSSALGTQQARTAHPPLTRRTTLAQVSRCARASLGV